MNQVYEKEINMQKRSMFMTIAIVLVALLTSFAQVTTESGDTLFVSPFDTDGVTPLLGALNMAINGDTIPGDTTLATQHSVYVLTLGAQYILTEAININSPIEICAPTPDPTAGIAGRPPVIRAGLKEDGSAVDMLWHIYSDVKFKNIWASGINLDGTGPISWIFQDVGVSGVSITYEGCVVEFPYTWWATFADWANRNKYFITDCIFQYLGNPTGAMWNGSIFHNSGADTMIVKNSSFFDFGCFAIHCSPGQYYTELDHCTLVNSHVHPVTSHEHIIQKYTNNVFVNCHAISDDDAEIKRHFDQEVKGLMNYAEIQWDPQQLDSLFGPGGEYGYNYDPNGDGELVHEETVFEQKNNCWWYTQPIEDYWAAMDMTPNPWMNNYNQAMFDNKDGAWTWDVMVYEECDSVVSIDDSTGDTTFATYYCDSSMTTMEHDPFLYFTEENTWNVDPGIIDMKGCDELLAQNATNIKKVERGIEVPEEDVVAFHNVDSYLAFTWPLDYNLAYTNAELWNAATDGGPLGDPQWFTGSNLVPLEENSKPIAKAFELSQNYPNPFNPSTTIDYTIAKPGDVKLTIFNVLGKKVNTLVDEAQVAGTYSMKWDGKNAAGKAVATGMYFYKLQVNDQVEVKKMMLMK